MVYCDEVSFTKRAIQKKEWSARYTNIQINEKEYYVPYWSVIAAVSETQGLVLAKSHDSAIDRYDFKKFLKTLHHKMAREPFALYMDNLAVHKTKVVMKQCSKLNITPLWNLSYSPDTNPIESCFAQVKKAFKKRRLHCLVNNIEFDMKKEIHKSFKVVTKELVKNCVKFSMRTLVNLNFE